MPIKPDSTKTRTGNRGRPHALNDPEFAKQVAQAFVDGLSRQDMADLFGIKDLSTITRWRRDPRVKAHSHKLIEDRILQITRKVDSEIEGRLANSEQMTIDELLRIRKEFLGGAARAQTEKADDITTVQAMRAIEENPNLMEELEKLLTGEQEQPEPAKA